MLLSKEYLRKVANQLRINEYNLNHSFVINENAQLTHAETLEEYEIFLSHSSLDKSLVLALVHLFNEAGYSVYVDWIEDKQLDRSKVDPNTASTLRKRMQSSKGLAYIATQNTTNSRWCPWELGYFDGLKNGRCCVLPIVDAGFKGQEYLGLYPYLDYDIGGEDSKIRFWVNDQTNKNRYIILKKWLQGNEPYEHEG